MNYISRFQVSLWEQLQSREDSLTQEHRIQTNTTEEHVLTAFHMHSCLETHSSLWPVWGDYKAPRRHVRYHLAVSPSSAYSEDHGSFSDFCSLAVSTRTFVLRANADGKCAHLQLWCAISRVMLPDTLNPQGFNPPPTSLLQLRGRKRSTL